MSCRPFDTFMWLSHAEQNAKDSPLGKDEIVGYSFVHSERYLLLYLRWRPRSLSVSSARDVDLLPPASLSAVCSYPVLLMSGSRYAFNLNVQLVAVREGCRKTLAYCKRATQIIFRRVGPTAV